MAIERCLELEIQKEGLELELQELMNRKRHGQEAQLIAAEE